MDYKVILSPKAIRDLQTIARYIAPDSPENARRFGFTLIEKTKIIRSFPEIGRVVPEFAEPQVREIIFRSYRIVYRVNHQQKVVEVSRFWHAARGTPELGD